MTPPSPAQRTIQYRCVECSAPASSLYKEYTATSIKLTSCVLCGKNVDPYVERGGVLIVLDCILLRAPAYRHILWNMDFKMHLWKVPQYVFGASFLQAYLGWELIQTIGHNTTIDTFARLVILSISKISAQGATIFVMIKHFDSNSRDINVYQISLAVTLPLLFSIIIALVLIWENTLTVQILGRLLEVAFQYNAITVIMDWGTSTFLLSIFTRLCINAVFRHMLSLPCLGISWEKYCIAL